MDYFGARYYASNLGRFMSPDPESAGALSDDPQSWNAYSYAGNNPLLYRDPDGRSYRVCDLNGKHCFDFKDNKLYKAWLENNPFLQEAGGKIYIRNENGTRIAFATVEYYDAEAYATLARVDRMAGLPVRVVAGVTLAFTGAAMGLELAAAYGELGITPGWFRISIRNMTEGLQGHHPFVQFLGGSARQTLTSIPRVVHREFHALLNSELRKAGFKLNVGGRGGSAFEWARELAASPAKRAAAFEAMRRTASAIDAKYGTNMVGDLLRNAAKENSR